MTYKKLSRQIKNKNITSAYLFYGEEEYLIDYFVEKIKKTFIPKEVESLNFAVLNGSEVDIQTVYNACETLPFMSEKRIVVIYDLNIFSRNSKKTREKNNFNKKSIDRLEEYISNLPEEICIIFVEKKKSVAKNKRIVKRIDKLNGLVEFGKLRGRELDNWVEKVFRKRGKKISKPNINYLIQTSAYFDRSNNKTLYDLENEIIKLSSYLGSRDTVTKHDIADIVVEPLERNIFKLLDNISVKNIDNALKTFNEMYLLNEPIQLILHMITRQFRLMLMYKLLSEKGYYGNDISKKMKVKSYEFNKIRGYSRNFSTMQLEQALNYCLEVDRYIKTSLMDGKLAMEMLLINLCKLKAY